MRDRLIHWLAERFTTEVPRAGSGRDYVRVLILSNVRSGSTALVSALDSHSRCVCFSEVFNPRRPMFYVAGWKEGSRLLKAYRDSFPREFLDRVVFGGYEPTVAAVGFKAFPAQIHDPRFAAVLQGLARDPRTRVIRLTRRNKLAQYLSMMRAERSGVWSSSDGKAEDTTPLRLYPAECRRAFARLRAADEFLDRLVSGREALSLAYEDLLRDERGAYAVVQAHVGLAVEPLRPAVRRQRTVPLADAIANPGELEAAFAGTEDEAFLMPEQPASS